MRIDDIIGSHDMIMFRLRGHMHDVIMTSNHNGRCPFLIGDPPGALSAFAEHSLSTLLMKEW